MSTMVRVLEAFSAVQKAEAARRAAAVDLSLIISGAIACGDVAEMEEILAAELPEEFSSELKVEIQRIRAGIPDLGKRPSIVGEPVVGSRVCYSDHYLTERAYDPKRTNAIRIGTIVGADFYANEGAYRTPTFVSPSEGGLTIANVRWDDERPGFWEGAEPGDGNGVHALNLCAIAA